jgi:4-hydroxy-tetrahydrodipicolinate reductase
MALNVVISGVTGRMGRAVAARLATTGELRLLGGIGRRRAELETGQRVEPPAAAGALIRGADVVVDFSSPACLAALLEQQWEALAGRALVVGTTGLEPAQLERLSDLAARSPVLRAANFSVGVNVLLALVREAALRLRPEQFDAEIVETHHRRKADAPSGTALALGEALAAGWGADLDERRRDGRSGSPGERPRGEIGLHAVRGGGVAGEHRVLFLGELERIELAHAAEDRAVFADGAVLAARWLAGREPGEYGMAQVLALA